MQEAGDLARASLGWVNLGVGLFIAAIVAGVGFFLWAYRDKMRDARALLTLAALLISLPLAGRLVLERTSFRNIAAEELGIVAVEVNRTDNKDAVIYLTLSRPAVAYIEFKPLRSDESVLMFALGKVEPRIGHTFVLKDNGVGGEVIFVLNGQKMLWQGASLVIPGI